MAREIYDLLERFRKTKCPRVSPGVSPGVSGGPVPQTSRQPRAPSRGLWRLRACPPRDLEDFARKAGHGRSRSQQPVTNVTKVASKRDQNEIDYILKCQAEAAHLLLELYTLYLFQLHI